MRINLTDGQLQDIGEDRRGDARTGGAGVGKVVRQDSGHQVRAVVGQGVQELAARNRIPQGAGLGLRSFCLNLFERQSPQPRCVFQVIKLLDHFCHSFSFYLVLEYVVSGLPEMLHDDGVSLDDSHLKTYARMLLDGVLHMHSTNIMHRVSSVFRVFVF